MDKENNIFGYCGSQCSKYVEDGWDVIKCENGISLCSKKGDATIENLCFECPMKDDG